MIRRDPIGTIHALRTRARRGKLPLLPEPGPNDAIASHAAGGSAAGSLKRDCIQPRRRGARIVLRALAAVSR